MTTCSCAKGPKTNTHEPLSLALQIRRGLAGYEQIRPLASAYVLLLAVTGPLLATDPVGLRRKAPFKSTTAHRGAEDQCHSALPLYIGLRPYAFP
jgi:hypothetical protein